MPRKKILGPATASQVLGFYETASEDAIAIVSDLVNGVLTRRFKPPTGTGTGSTPGKRPRRTKKLPATESETLGEA